MIITEIRIKLERSKPENPRHRLRAYASLTFDNCLAVRELRIVETDKGLVVFMPSRKRMDHCPDCNGKNTLQSYFCNYCGFRLDEARANREIACKECRGMGVAECRFCKGKGMTLPLLYSDVCHPIHSEFRDYLTNEVLQAYQREVEASKQPDYICSY